MSFYFKIFNNIFKAEAGVNVQWQKGLVRFEPRHVIRGNTVTPQSADSKMNHLMSHNR